MRALLPLLIATCLACGSSAAPGGCRTNAECGPGLLCIVPASGQGGSCQKPPIAIALTAPAAGARVGAAGVPVAAQVTLAASDAAPPASVVVMIDGSEAGALALTARDGGVLSYAGSYLPPSGQVFAPTLFVAAKTSAGLVPSDGVFVQVDTKPPVLTLVNGPACGKYPACPRDGGIDIFVSLAEDHPDVVEATVDLDGHQAAVPFGPAQIGTALVVSIPLGNYPFPHFSGAVTPRVRARDAFGNESSLDLPAFPVTRLRWAYDAGAPVTAAAIMADGSAVVGVSATTSNLHAIRSDGLARWTSTLTASGRTTGSFVTSAPSIGANTIWVGSEDGKLYGRVDANTIFGCPATAAVGSMYTPAMIAGPTEEVAYSAGSASSLYAAASSKSCVTSSGVSTTDPVTTAAVVSGGKLFLLTARAARSTVHRYSPGPAEEATAVTSCGTILAPPALDQNGHILVSCAGGEIVRSDKSTLAPTIIATLADYAPESIVLFSNGDMLVGTNDGKLHRLTPPATGSGSWTDAWAALPALSASVRGVLVAAPDRDGVVAYAVTADGQLHALDADGHARWSTAGEPSRPLGISPLTFPTIAPAASAAQLPTLYAGSDDGHLYAVVVDSGLDPASPWPKSHHDVRNTGNADAPVYP